MLGFLKQLLQKQRKITIKGNIMKFNDNQNYDVDVYCTDELLSINTMSGFGRCAKDYDVPEWLLLPNEDDKTIGETILFALSKSRTITLPEERAIFFNLEISKEKYQEWYKNLMQKYNYKNKKALFQNMKSCGVGLKNSIITIRPSRHEKLEAWGRTRGDGIEDVILSLDNSPEEIGAGLKLAFSRCI